MVPRTSSSHLQRPTLPPRASSTAKASFVSPSSSFEGDDERSGEEHSEMDSDDDSHTLPRVPRFPGEDVRPTSSKELLGWYSYGWASEVFVVCGVGSFIPITLEQLAREVGVFRDDHKTPCTAKAPVDIIDHASRLLARAPSTEKRECIVRILGADVNTASFAMYTFSLSVLLQAVVIVSMSGAADHGRYRKTFLLAFAAVGALTTMLFLPVTPSVLMLGAFFAIISNTCYGASYVLLNSFLPLLVRRHPSIPQHDEPYDAPEPDHFSEDREILGMSDSTTTLLPSQAPTTNITPPTAKSSPELQLSTKVSAYGIGIGYIAAVTVQIVGIIVLFMMDSTLFSLRVVLFIIGLWWAVFTVPSALFLRPRPGPPLAAARSWWVYVTHSWALLGRTVLQARRLKDVAIFLIAWFLLSDALATVSSTAILFAKTDLLMAPPALAFISVIATLFGVCGAFLWSAVSLRYHLTPIQTLASIIFLFELIPLYGLLGFIPAIRNLGVFGLQKDWEMYILGAVYGLVLGGVGAYCRSLFGELIPPGSEAAFYALYAITDKGSSVFGPAIVGAITDRCGEIRPAFIFLAVLIAVPLPLFLRIDLPRGRAAGRRLVAADGALSDASSTAAAYTPVSVVISDEDEERVAIIGARPSSDGT